MSDLNVPKMNIGHLQNLTQAVRLAHKRGAFSMEESSQLTLSVQEIELWIESFRKYSAEDNTDSKVKEGE